MRRIVLLSLLVTASLEAQLSQKSADAIVPVVGSTRGQSNANFKTEVQLANPTDTRIDGWLIFHRQGQAGSVNDPVLRYELAPRATAAYADVLADLGATGLGSLDIFVDRGVVPAVVARAFDDQPAGTTGVTVPLVPFTAALTHGDSGTLVAPRDPVRFRFNVGIRSLDNGASIDVIVRDAGGAERKRQAMSYPATFFEQAPGNVFAGVALQANDSIEIRVISGGVVVYATAVDNQTNDSSIQVLKR